MEQASILLWQLVTMFLYVGVGWCLCRAGLVTTQNNSALTNLLLYVILPCVVVKSFLRPATAQDTEHLLWSLLLSVLALALAMGVSFWCSANGRNSTSAAPFPTQGSWASL